MTCCRHSPRRLFISSLSGWLEPEQRPAFEQITAVLDGMVQVEHESGVLEVQAGQGGRHLAGRVGALQQRRVRTARSTSPLSPLHRDE
jgi:hypothetical protein